MKKTLGIIITAAIILSLSACSDKAEAQTGSPEAPTASPYIENSLDEDFFSPTMTL